MIDKKPKRVHKKGLQTHVVDQQKVGKQYEIGPVNNQIGPSKNERAPYKIKLSKGPGGELDKHYVVVEDQEETQAMNNITERAGVALARRIMARRAAKYALEKRAEHEALNRAIALHDKRKGNPPRQRLGWFSEQSEDPKDSYDEISSHPESDSVHTDLKFFGDREGIVYAGKHKSGYSTTEFFHTPVSNLASAEKIHSVVRKQNPHLSTDDQHILAKTIHAHFKNLDK